MRSNKSYQKYGAYKSPKMRGNHKSVQKLFQFLGMAFLLFAANTSNVLAQQSWERQYHLSKAVDVVQTQDGRYATAGNTEALSLSLSWYLLKIDEAGDSIWSKTYVNSAPANARAFIQTNDGGFVIAGESELGIVVKKLDANGNQLWSNTYPVGIISAIWDVKEDNEANLLLAGEHLINPDAASHIFLLKLNPDGDELFTNAYTNNPTWGYWSNELITLSDGGYFLSGYGQDLDGNPQMFCIKTDQAGDTAWTIQRAFTVAYAAAELPDGSLIVSGFEKNQISYQNDFILLKFDANGNELWAQTDYPIEVNTAYDVYEILLSDDGGYLIVSNAPGTTNSVRIIKTMGNGSFEWHKSFGGEMASTALGGVIDADGNVLFSGYRYTYAGDALAYLSKVNLNGNQSNVVLSGSVVSDQNADCQANAGDVPLVNRKIRLIGQSNDTIVTNTNQHGAFELLVDTGTYQISILPAHNYYDWCSPNHTISTTSQYDSISVNFVGQIATDCPYMMVEVSTPVLKHCASNKHHFVYCNNGTANAHDVRVEVFFDPAFELTESTLPWSYDPIKLKHVFDIGTVPFGVCDTFAVSSLLACDVQIGRSHCVKARIYPDTLCSPPNPIWTNGQISIDTKCLSDSIRITVGNYSPFAVEEPEQGILEVYEDNVMLRRIEYNLLAMQDTVIMHQSEGKTVRVRAEQVALHPGDDRPTQVIEGCGVEVVPAESLGLVNSTYHNEFDPFVSIDCSQSVDVLDEAMLNVTPSGVYEQHYINPDDEPEYHIHFQNMGADTARLIIVRDTLPIHLDAASINSLSASHPHEFLLREGNVLEWRFNNIEIPGSDINAPESMGYVKYAAKIKPETPLGTVINNSAHVYFNFRVPVATNTVFNTVDTAFFIINVIPEGIPQHPSAELKLYPNPTVQTATFDISGFTPTSDLFFELYDLSGKQVKTHSLGKQTSFRINRGSLPDGVYIYRIRTQQNLIAKGKLVVSGRYLQAGQTGQ